ncbi:hypothetical protein FCULG_00007204 [Fusarium culmorum]|uniref:Uncharacterized protein n=1 Tax=Fusarium culmorum TaxID=5516 RepID=A0A2T4GVX8_FUSCU|nr:hypothetical protein FCULG_00007204 [Fusarium culmorum]
MASVSDAEDVERQSNHVERTSPPIPKDVPNLRERAGQGCFLCLETHSQGQYAVLVPMSITNQRTGKITTIYDPNSLWDSAGESDCEIYQRLLDACYQRLGWWKRWLPYYGIIKVTEFNFQFGGVVESDRRYPIYMEPANLEDISEKCNQAIARHPTDSYFDLDQICLDDREHSDECLIGMWEWSQPCIKVEAEKAEQRLKQPLFLSRLKDCTRDPMKVNGLDSLKGMAQDTCIYEIKGPKGIDLPLPNQEFRCTAWRRGLQFALGWQIDRMCVELPFRASCTALAVALIWLCVVIWRGAGVIGGLHSRSPRLLQRLLQL